MNYNGWPWSEQNCTLVAGSWTYDSSEIDVQPYLSDESGVAESPLKFGGEFEHENDMNNQV